jgi:hypothetical protein
MDFHWRKAWARRLVEQGWREGLTYRELSERSGASERSLRRWTRALRLEKASRPISERVVAEEGATPRVADCANSGFTELPTKPSSRIQVEVSLRLG